MFWQKLLYAMVWKTSKLVNIGEYSGHFMCLCVVYWFVNSFVHQNMKDFVHNIKNYEFTNSFDNHLTITLQLWQFGNMANVIWKKSRMLVMLLAKDESTRGFTLCNRSGTASLYFLRLNYCVHELQAPSNKQFLTWLLLPFQQ